MEEFVEITADGRRLQLRRNIPLLQALKEKGIMLPALCYSSKLAPNGSCGLCILEVYQEGVWKVQRACLLQAERGLLIRTGSARISRLRARTARLLLKRGPFRKQEVEKLLLGLLNSSGERNQEAGANPPQQSNEGCILCGLCIAVCGKVGKNRLVFLGRGKNLQVGMVEGPQADSCGLCQACRRICPTGFISHTPRQAFTARLYN